MQVGHQKVVSIDYTLTDPSGKVIDSSKGRQPLPYMHGMGALIPGLEKALDGKVKGDALQVDIPPEQGYGLRDASLVEAVPRQNFPKEIDITVGLQFQTNTPQGPRVVTVVGVETDTIKVDANHPLAGVPLHFDVTIVDVREATAEEISHGHVHGPGGHHHH